MPGQQVKWHEFIQPSWLSFCTRTHSAAAPPHNCHFLADAEADADGGPKKRPPDDSNSSDSSIIELRRQSDRQTRRGALSWSRASYSEQQASSLGRLARRRPAEVLHRHDDDDVDVEISGSRK